MSKYAPYNPSEPGRPAENVAVRAAAMDDVRRIAEIHTARDGGEIEETIAKVALDLERIARREVQRYTCVAEVDRLVVAFGRCRLMVNQGEPRLPDGWYLAGVIVDQAYRRLGIGRRVTAHRLDWLCERTDVVHYLADESNRASIDLHAAFGFEEVARKILPPERRTDAPQALFRKHLP